MPRKPRDMPGDQPWLLPVKPPTEAEKQAFDRMVEEINRVNSAARQKKESKK